MIAKLKEKERGRKHKSIFFSILIIFLLLATISFLVINNIRIKREKVKFTAQINILRDKINQAEKRKEELEKEISRARSKDNLEEIARNQLGLKKPGEEVVVVKKLEKKNDENEEENRSLWEAIKRIFNR